MTLRGGIYDLINSALLEKMKQFYPIGKIEINVSGENPNTYLGFGTWIEWGSGRVPVGVDTSDSDFSTVEKTGGEKKHTLSINEMAVHSHNMYHTGRLLYWDSGLQGMVKVTATPNSGAIQITWDTKTADTGGGQPFNIQQKYITCYMYKRTA